MEISNEIIADNADFTETLQQKPAIKLLLFSSEQRGQSLDNTRSEY